MAGLLDPVIKETIVGSAEVRQSFRIVQGRPGGRLHGYASVAWSAAKCACMPPQGIIYEGVTQIAAAVPG